VSIRINLLAPERKVRRPPNVLAIGLLVLAVLVAALGAWTVSLQNRVARLRGEVATVQAAVERLRPQAAEVERLRARLAAVERREKLLQELFAGQIPAAEAVNELAAVIPQDSWITEFAVQGGRTVQVAGTTTASNVSLARFMVNLENSTFFRNVDLSVSERQRIGDREVVRFSLTAELEGKPAPAATPQPGPGGTR
jgi:Tfp pilus assembly protein PilN